MPTGAHAEQVNGVPTEFETQFSAGLETPMDGPPPWR